MRILQHDLQKMNIKPGFSESVFEAHTVKAKAMNDRDHNVSLVFDEMSIKKPYFTMRNMIQLKGLKTLDSKVKQSTLPNHAIALLLNGNSH